MCSACVQPLRSAGREAPGKTQSVGARCWAPFLLTTRSKLEGFVRARQVFTATRAPVRTALLGTQTTREVVASRAAYYRCSEGHIGHAARLANGLRHLNKIHASKPRATTTVLAIASSAWKFRISTPFQPIENAHLCAPLIAALCRDALHAARRRAMRRRYERLVLLFRLLRSPFLLLCMRQNNIRQHSTGFNEKTANKKSDQF